jgi:hypothetical protein
MALFVGLTCSLTRALSLSKGAAGPIARTTGEIPTITPNP